MWEGMKAADDLSGLPAFMGAAFFFGMVHALMPGHGKSVLVSYHLGKPTSIVDGFLTGTLLSVTHVGIAVVFVLAGVAVISRSLAAAGRAPAFEVLSAGLIIVIGLFLIYRAVWPPAHVHSRDGRTLAMATGLVPCPLTTFILTYALAHNKLSIGMAAVVAMLGGVIVTIASFAVAAVYARARFMSAMDRTETWRARVGFWAELLGALAVVVLGVLMLREKLPWLSFAGGLR
jgi:nickel/cobalt exporter